MKGNEMARILSSILLGLALLVGGTSVLGTSVAYADDSMVRVSRAQVGAECFTDLGDAGYKTRTRFGRETRDVPALTLLSECGIGSVRAEDGSRVPTTYYSN